MRIWVDADACPVPVKETIFRASRRVGLPVTLVANRPLLSPPGQRIETIQVGSGFDEADHYLVERAQPGDLVVTADVPLAARLVAQGIAALNPRGELYTSENIQERLALRDLKESLRSAGVGSGGPMPYHARDRQAFANSLDRWLARNYRPLEAP